MHSIVYRCVRKASGSIFAVKISRSDDEEKVASFRQEYEILKGLDHPNVIKVHEIFTNPLSGEVHSVMDYAKGENMQQLIDKAQEDGTPIPHSKIVDIVRQMLHAVAHLHSKKVVHRDLKPDNFIVGDDSTLKLIDFNVAKKWDNDQKLMT
jgi:serine/threonine protein kinase